MNALAINVPIVKDVMCKQAALHNQTVIYNQAVTITAHRLLPEETILRQTLGVRRLLRVLEDRAVRFEDSLVKAVTNTGGVYTAPKLSRQCSPLENVSQLRSRLNIGIPGIVPRKVLPSVQRTGENKRAEQDSRAEQNPVLSIHLLGPSVEVTLNGQPISIPHARAMELLLYLALSGGASRDQLVNALWDGDANPHHTEYFKVIVRRLRSMLSSGPHIGFNPLPFEQGHYALAKEFNIQTDIGELKKAICAHQLGTLKNKLEDHCSVGIMKLQSEWGQLQAEGVLDLITEALQVLGQADTSLATKRWAYENLVRVDIVNQDAHLALIKLLKESNDAVAAHLAYKNYARMMSKEYKYSETVKYGKIM
jgi:DNA-binding SARP family transcriptional activator